MLLVIDFCESFLQGNLEECYRYIWPALGKRCHFDFSKYCVMNLVSTAKHPSNIESAKGNNVGANK